MKNIKQNNHDKTSDNIALDSLNIYLDERNISEIIAKSKNAQERRKMKAFIYKVN